MEYENTEIPDLYEVYSNNDGFIIDKTIIKWKSEWEYKNIPDLYDIYPNNDDFIVDTPLPVIKTQSSHTNPSSEFCPPKTMLLNDTWCTEVCFIRNYVKMSNRKYRIFLETEYLEELYQEINIFFSANKAITLEAISPKGYEKQPNKLTCVIPIEYPLVPPIIYMNDKLYMNHIYCCHLERVKIIISKYSMSYKKYMNCISCACVLNNGNWNEKIMFSNIFSEWDKIRRMKKIVGYELALEDLMIYRDLDYCNIIHIMEYLL